MLAIRNQDDIDVQQVLLNIGYDADCQPPSRVMTLIDECIEEASPLIQPSYSYVIRDIRSVQGARAVIDDSITFRSNVIARLLRQCDQVAVLVATIGESLEGMVHQLIKDRQVLRAMVLDAVGSAAAERVADFVQDEISRGVRHQGLSISLRFSPGYCDWDISQQEMVFRAMNSNLAGVRLTERHLMLPSKSISGIIGIGHQGAGDYNPCKTCKKPNCPGRR